jgi:hypothetical protein
MRLGKIITVKEQNPIDYNADFWCAVIARQNPTKTLRSYVTYTLYEIGGHSPHWENSERFNEELAMFVKTILGNDLLGCCCYEDDVVLGESPNSARATFTHIRTLVQSRSDKCPI